MSAESNLYEIHEVTNIACPVCDTAVPPENLLEHLMYHVAMDDPIIVHGKYDNVYTFPLSYISKVMYEFDVAGGGTYLIFEWLKNPEIVEVLSTLYNNSIALPTKNETLYDVTVGTMKRN